MPFSENELSLVLYQLSAVVRRVDIARKAVGVSCEVMWLGDGLEDSEVCALKMKGYENDT